MDHLDSLTNESYEEDRSGVSIHAGFPNPAAERSKKLLSLDALLVRHPSSSYLFRITGSSGEMYGIFDGDIALVDRALVPRDQDLVVSWEEEQFTIVRYIHGKTELWGVISACIHDYRQPKPL
jgi:DNA polymerase V